MASVPACFPALGLWASFQPRWPRLGRSYEPRSRPHSSQPHHLSLLVVLEMQGFPSPGFQRRTPLRDILSTNPLHHHHGSSLHTAERRKLCLLFCPPPCAAGPPGFAQGLLGSHGTPLGGEPTSVIIDGRRWGRGGALPACMSTWDERWRRLLMVPLEIVLQPRLRRRPVPRTTTTTTYERGG